MHVPNTNFQLPSSYQTCQQKIVIQVYLQNIYTTLSSSLYLVTYNGGEFKNKISPKVTKESGIKHKFSSPRHLKFEGILKKIHSFLKVCIRKHIHSKLDWEDTIQP